MGNGGEMGKWGQLLTLDKAFDKRGRLYSTHDASGSVQHTFYDYLGRVTQQWEGTNDVPSWTYFTRPQGDPSPGPDPRDFHYWNVVLNVDPTATVNAGVTYAGVLVQGPYTTVEGGSVSHGIEARMAR